MDGGSPANIDVLTYTYGDAARPDRLTNMADATNNAKGFKPATGAAAYQYDANGNMTQDNHKQFTFAYNHLNLPATMTKGTNVITMTYTADGEKLAKAVTGGATKNYISGIEYSGANLEAIYFSEGRCTPDGTSAFFYEYTIKDHLGNARVSFRAGAGATLSHLENMHYYPFGMLMEGLGTGTNSPANDYAYNGKELNEDFGLNWSDYGARWYDAALGRFPTVDPIIEKFPSLTPYNYASNNPVGNIDLWGLQGLSMHHLWHVLGLSSSGNMNYLNGKANALIPSAETSQRTNLVMDGAQTMGLGFISTLGAIEAAAMSGGYSVTALPFTFGEIGIGGAKILDGIFGDNPFSDTHLRQGGSAPGLLAYKNDSPHAELIDAVGQFLPGMVSGGNFVGAVRNANDILAGISSRDLFKVVKSSMSLVDAIGDVSGVVDATTNLKNSNSQQLDIPPALLDKYYQIQVKKSDIILSTKDIDDIKKFLEQHQNPN